MMDEFKLGEAAVKGMRAQELLDSEILTDTFTKLKADYLAQLMTTNVMETDIREKCYLAMRVVDVVHAHIRTVISNGKIAQSDLEQLAKVTDRPKRFGII